jgi:hypothetical protein
VTNPGATGSPREMEMLDIGESFLTHLCVKVTPKLHKSCAS